MNKLQINLRNTLPLALFADRLACAVVVSLFSDARARPEDAWHGDPRGWWGDELSDIDEDETGSRVWLLSRLKNVPDTLRRAEEYARECLSWLLDDGICRQLTVQASAPEMETLLLLILLDDVIEIEVLA